MIMTTEDTATAHQAIMNNADATLEALAVERQELQSRVQLIGAELSTIQAKADARRLQTEQAQRTATEARAAYETAKAHAKLAEGTALSQDAAAPLKAQASHVKYLEKESERLTAQHESDQAQEIARISDLMVQRNACELRLQQIAHELVTTQQAKEQAFRDLGECAYRDVALQVELAQAAIAAKEKDLATAKSDLAAVIDAGLEQLSRWPQHQQQIADLKPLDDATWRAIVAARTYLDALLAESKGLQSELPLPSTVGLWTWRQLLCVLPQDIYAYHHISGSGRPVIQNQRDRLVRLEQEYRQWRRPR
jgi:hypothetical protein